MKKLNYLFTLLLLTCNILAQTFGGGTGTVSDPYKISTPAHLAELATQLNSGVSLYLGEYFIQTANLDLSAYQTDGGWTPIGNNDWSPFMGHYDGNDYQITNLKINCTTSSYFNGLFGYVEQGTLKNINVLGDITVNSDNELYVGGLASTVQDGTIENCFSGVNFNLGVDGTGINSGSLVGGLISIMNCGSISNCNSNSQISLNITNSSWADSFVGGLVAKLQTVNLSNSYSEGTIAINISDDVLGATVRSGGAIGYCKNSNVSSSYSTVAVSGNYETGYYSGFIGYAENSINNITITDCHATGNIQGYEVGGFMGYNYLSNIVRCYSTGNITGSFSGGGFASTLAHSVVNDCYSLGNVTRVSGSNSNYFAGFAGYASYAGITKCYSIGSVVYTNSTNPTDKGFLAINLGSTMSNNFWDTQTSGQTTAAGTATGKTTAEMKTQSTFTTAGWDFTTVWRIVGSNYPDLQANSNTALPVELSAFSVSASIDKVVINWQTVTEKNNYGFEIERAKVIEEKAGDYSKIGFVEGHGNSNVIINYSYFDNTVSTGKYLYRLKQIDNDGNYIYSEFIEVEVNSMPIKYELSQNYPNPFNPNTTIKFSIPNKEFVSLKIFDILGNEVTTLINSELNAGYYESKWNAINIASGVYFYRISAGSFVETRKMNLIK